MPPVSSRNGHAFASEPDGWCLIDVLHFFLCGRVLVLTSGSLVGDAAELALGKEPYSSATPGRGLNCISGVGSAFGFGLDFHFGTGFGGYVKSDSAAVSPRNWSRKAGSADGVDVDSSAGSD